MRTEYIYSIKMFVSLFLKRNIISKILPEKLSLFQTFLLGFMSTLSGFLSQKYNEKTTPGTQSN